MDKYISSNPSEVTRQLYWKATSAVDYNGQIAKWFRTTVRVRQGCLLSPTLFNIFLAKIKSDALEHREGMISIGGRTTINLKFTDDTDGVAGRKTELKALVKHLHCTSKAYSTETNKEKTSIMANNKTKGAKNNITLSGQTLETVSKFKCLGAIGTDEGPRPEIHSCTAQATAAFAKLKSLRKHKNIRLCTKVTLQRS